MKIRSSKKGGGVSIFCHSRVKCVLLVKYEVDGLEAVWVEVRCDNIKLVVGSVYTPPAEFCRFGEQLARIISENREHASWNGCEW